MIRWLEKYWPHIVGYGLAVILLVPYGLSSGLVTGWGDALWIVFAVWFIGSVLADLIKASSTRYKQANCEHEWAREVKRCINKRGYGAWIRSGRYAVTVCPECGFQMNPSEIVWSDWTEE